MLPDVYQLIVRCEHICRRVTRLFFRSSVLGRRRIVISKCCREDKRLKLYMWIETTFTRLFYDETCRKVYLQLSIQISSDFYFPFISSSFDIFSVNWIRKEDSLDISETDYNDIHIDYAIPEIENQRKLAHDVKKKKQNWQHRWHNSITMISLKVSQRFLFIFFYFLRFCVT